MGAEAAAVARSGDFGVRDGEVDAADAGGGQLQFTAFLVGREIPEDDSAAVANRHERLAIRTESHLANHAEMAAKNRETLSDAVDWSRVDGMLDFGGIRLEDDVLITEDGCDVLTSDVPLLS